MRELNKGDLTRLSYIACFCRWFVKPSKNSHSNARWYLGGQKDGVRNFKHFVSSNDLSLNIIQIFAKSPKHVSCLKHVLLKKKQNWRKMQLLVSHLILHKHPAGCFPNVDFIHGIVGESLKGRLMTIGNGGNDNIYPGGGCRDSGLFPCWQWG